MAANDPFVPGANIGIRSVPNLRDIGGYATTGGGRVRAGVLYRSSALCKLSDPAATSRMLGSGRMVLLFQRGCRDIVTLPSALRSYRQFFSGLAAPALACTSTAIKEELARERGTARVLRKLIAELRT